MPLTKEKKEEIIDSYKQHDNDTGSAEVQIALLTNRIVELNKHFQTHGKDHHSRRGLLKLIGKRRRLLGYVKSKSDDRYVKLISSLGLRK